MARPRDRSQDELAKLFRQINIINPTDRGLGAREAARRYAEKAALQTALIARFGDQLLVGPDPRDPALVVLHHISMERDACHARLGELGEEARLWVRRRLVERELPAAASASLRPLPLPGQAPVSPLERGRKALEDYDYEAAEAAFEEALTRDPRDLQAALALVELLVDQLGRDADALKRAALLPEPARSAAPLRGLLATAAAREGEAARVERLLGDDTGPRAAECWAILLRRALAAGEREVARALLRRVLAAEPGHLEGAALTERLRCLDAAGFAPEEAAIQRLMAEQRWEEASLAAGTLRTRWPGSAVAARALCVWEEVQQERRRFALVEAARSAPPMEARALYREAIRSGASGLEEELSRVELAVQRLVDEAAATAVVAALQSGDRSRGLDAWVTLREEVRGLVSLVDPAMALLAPMSTARRSPAEYVRAALRALEAEAAWVNGDLDRALDLIEASKAEGILVAKELHQSLRTARLQRDARRSEAAVDEAAARMEAGDAEGARAALTGLVAEAASPELRVRAVALDRSIKLALDHHRREAAWQSATAAGDLFVQRQVAERQAAETGEPRWSQRREEAEAALHRAWRFEVYGEEQAGEAGWADLRDFNMSTHSLFIDTALLPSGEELFLVDSRERCVRLRRIRVADSKLLELICFETLQKLGIVTPSVQGERLWVLGVYGAVCLSMSPWRLLHWQPASLATSSNEDPWNMVAPPGGSLLWMNGPTFGGPSGTVRIVDLETGRVVERMRDCEQVTLLSGPPALLARQTPNQKVTFHRADGAITRRVEVSGRSKVAVAAHPNITGAVVAGPSAAPSREVGAGTEMGTGPVQIHELSWNPGDELRAFDLPGTLYFEEEVELATATDSALSFVLCPSTQPGGYELIAIGGGKGRIRERWRSRVPNTSRLIQDIQARAAALVGMSTTALWTLPLGAAPPPVGPEHFMHTVPIFSLSPPFTLMSDSWVVGKLRDWRARQSETLGEITSLSESDIDKIFLDSTKDSVGRFCLAASFFLVGNKDASRRIFSLGAQRFPRDPLLCLGRLHAAAERCEWAEVRQLASSLDQGALAEGPRAMAAMMIGAACLHEGDVAAARAAWDKPAVKAQLSIHDWLLAFCDEVQGLPDEEGHRLGTLGPLAEANRAIRVADQAIAEGKPNVAIRALDQTNLWRMCDIQVAARLSAATLETPAEGPRQRWILANTLHLIDDRGPEHPWGIELGPASWSKDQIRAVAERARAALGWG